MDLLNKLHIQILNLNFAGILKMEHWMSLSSKNYDYTIAFGLTWYAAPWRAPMDRANGQGHPPHWILLIKTNIIVIYLKVKLCTGSPYYNKLSLV